MNRESFLEKITGKFLDGTSIESVLPENLQIKSVSDHLSRILNTRQGSLSHVPDYGIPDVAQLYRGLPGSFEKLKTTLLNLINKYEPRLERVQVQLNPFDPVDMTVSFQLAGYLPSGHTIVIKTDFASTGEVGVDGMKKVR